VSAIKEELEIVADALKPRDVDIKGRPVWGNAHAPVTVVVFADFECPHCKAESPLLRQTVDQFGGKAKLVYKHFPLVAHPRAKMAAIAAEAAHEQDKFWPMHDILFANQTALEDKDIYRYAERIGLDMAKFKASYEARKGEKIVESDRAHGEDLGLEGTPTVFVNGRLFVQHDSLLGGTLAGWIDDALKR
jgi:protein-disulfide isomerase